MKTILVLITLIGLVVFGGITYFESLNEPVLVENTASEEVVEEAPKSTLELLVEAQEAAQTERATLVEQIKVINQEAEGKTDVIQAQIDELDKQLNVY